MTTPTLNSQINSFITQITTENADKITIDNSIKSFNSLIGKFKENQISLAFRESLSKWIENPNNRNLVNNKILENFLKFIHQSILFKTLKFNEFFEYMKWAESEDRLRGEIAINILCTMEGYSFFKNFENGLDFLSQFDYFKLSLTTVDKVNKFLELLFEEDSDYINLEYIPMIENLLNRIYYSSSLVGSSIIKPSPRIFNFVLNIGKLEIHNDIEQHKKFIPMLRSLLAILAINNSSFLKLTKFIFRLIHIICSIPLSNYSFEKRQTIFKNHYSTIIPFIFENFQNCKEDLNKLKLIFGEIVEEYSYKHLLTLIQSNRFEKVTLNIISSLQAGPTLEKNIVSIFNTVVCFINCDILRDDAYSLLEYHMPNFSSYLPELHAYVLPLVYKQQSNFPISTFKTYFKSHQLLTLSQFPILFKNLSTTRIDIINHTLLTHNKEIIETHYNNFLPNLLEVLLDPYFDKPYNVLPSIGSSIQTIGKNEFFDKIVLNISNHLFSIKVLRLDSYEPQSIGEIVLGLFKIYKAYSKDYVNLWNLGINTFLHYLNTTSTTMYLLPYVKDILEKYPIDSIPYVKQFEEKLLKNFEIISINSQHQDIVEQYIELFEKLNQSRYFNYLYNYNLKPPQFISSSSSTSNTPISLSSSSLLQKSQSINSFSGSSNTALHKSQSITLITSNNTNSSTNLTKSSSNNVLSSSQMMKNGSNCYVVHKFTINKIIDSLKLVNSKFRNHKINLSILKIIASLFDEFGMDKSTGNIKQVLIGVLNQQETIELIKNFNLNTYIPLSSIFINQLFSINSIGKEIKILFNQLTKESRSFILQFTKSFIRDIIINTAPTTSSNNTSAALSAPITSNGTTMELFIGDNRFKHIKTFIDFMIPINGDTINNYILEQLIIYEKYKKYSNPLLVRLILYLIEDESKFPLSASNLDYLIQLKTNTSILFIEKIWKVYGLDTLRSSKYFDRNYQIVTIQDNSKSKMNLLKLNGISSSNSNSNSNVTTTTSTTTTSSTSSNSNNMKSPLSPRPNDHKDLNETETITTPNGVSISSPLPSKEIIVSPRSSECDSSSTLSSNVTSLSASPSISTSSITSSPGSAGGSVKTTSTITTITKTTSTVETKLNRYSNIAGNGDIIKSSTILSNEKIEKPVEITSTTKLITTNNPVAAGIEILPNKQNRYSNISGNGDIIGKQTSQRVEVIDKKVEKSVDQTATIYRPSSGTMLGSGSTSTNSGAIAGSININPTVKLNDQIYKPTLISQTTTATSNNNTSNNSNNNKLQASPTKTTQSTIPIPGNAAGAQPSPPQSPYSTSSSLASSTYISLPPSPSNNTTISRDNNVNNSPYQLSSSSSVSASPSSTKIYRKVIIPKNHIDDYGYVISPSSKPSPQLEQKLKSKIIEFYVNDETISIKEKIESIAFVSKEFHLLLSNELSNWRNICKLIKSKPLLSFINDNGSSSSSSSLNNSLGSSNNSSFTNNSGNMLISSDYSLLKGLPNYFSMDSIHKFPFVYILLNHDKLFNQVHSLEINTKSLYSFELSNTLYQSLKNLIILNSVGECVNPQNGEEIALSILKQHSTQLETLELNYNFSGLSLDGAMDLEKDLIDLNLLNEVLLLTNNSINANGGNTSGNGSLIKSVNFNFKSIHSMSSLSLLYQNYLSKLSTTSSPLVSIDLKLSKQCKDSIVDGEAQFKSQIVPFIKSLEIHYPENDFIFKHSSDNYLNLSSLLINLNTSSSIINSSGGVNSGTASPPPPNSTIHQQQQTSTFLNLYLKNKKIKLSKLKFKTNSISLINQILLNSLIELNHSIKTIEISIDLDTTTIYYDHMSIINGDYFSSDLNQLFTILEKNQSIEKLIIKSHSNHNDMIFIDRDHWNRINTCSFKPIRLNSLNLFERFLKNNHQITNTTTTSTTTTTTPKLQTTTITNNLIKK